MIFSDRWGAGEQFSVVWFLKQMGFTFLQPQLWKCVEVDVWLKRKWRLHLKFSPKKLKRQSLSTPRWKSQELRGKRASQHSPQHLEKIGTILPTLAKNQYGVVWQRVTRKNGARTDCAKFSLVTTNITYDTLQLYCSESYCFLVARQQMFYREGWCWLLLGSSDIAGSHGSALLLLIQNTE